MIKKEMINPIKLLIFDCDGVLFDSRRANEEYYNHILKAVGRAPLTKAELDFVHMHSLPECLDYLFREHPHLKEEAIKVSKETSYSKFFPYMILEEGIKDFLDWAHQRFFLALCTNRTTSTKPLLEHFDLSKYFHLVRTALDYPKSNPLALATILSHFKVMPHESIYIGDSVIDENLCESCKVPLISYKNPSLKAIKVIYHYEELKTFLQSNGLCSYRDLAP